MLNTLNIGKYIYGSLTNENSGITCKSYPLVADNNAKYPFIIYRRLNLQSSNSKDYIFEDVVTVEIIVVSDKYAVGIDLAQKIRKIFERQSVTFDDIEINDGIIILATEEFNDNAYVQRMQFQFKIQKINI